MSRETLETDRVKAWRRRVRARWLRMTGRPEDASYWMVRSLPGFLPKADVRLLYRMASTEPGPGDIAEVGSWMGKSTVAMARALQDHRVSNCRIYAIDPHAGSTTQGDEIARAGSTFPHFQENIRSARVESLIEPMVMTSTEAGRELARRGVRLRLAFIDGLHEEEPVREDIHSFLPLMKPKGLMAFHDCNPEGGAFPGVWRALDSELLQTQRAEVVEHTAALWVVRLRN
jgi:predicted O-methyltransferase YrrM